jgi:hypothetical protein
MKNFLIPFFILGTAFSLRLENANQSIHGPEIKKNSNEIDSFKEVNTGKDEKMGKIQ